MTLLQLRNLVFSLSHRFPEETPILVGDLPTEIVFEQVPTGISLGFIYDQVTQAQRNAQSLARAKAEAKVEAQTSALPADRVDSPLSAKKGKKAQVRPATARLRAITHKSESSPKSETK